MLYALDLSIKKSREGTRIIQFQGRDSSSPEGNENIANIGEGGSLHYMIEYKILNVKTILALNLFTNLIISL